MSDKKKLLLIRGLPGSGKSTLAKMLSPDFHIEADMYFLDAADNYEFKVAEIKAAHKWCLENVHNWMHDGEPLIVVSNTFTQAWEMDAYFVLADTYNYEVTSMIVENRHEGANVHGVPSETITKMKNQFEVKL